MKKTHLLIFIFLSNSFCFGQQLKTITGYTLLPFFCYYTQNSEGCVMNILKDSICNYSDKMSLNQIYGDQILAFVLIEFDSISNFQFHYKPKNIKLDKLIWFDLNNGSRKWFVYNDSKGYLNEQEIMNFEDAKKLEQFISIIISNWEFSISPFQDIICNPLSEKIEMEIILDLKL